MSARKAAQSSPKPRAKEIGVGVIGLGYMGHTHVAAYRTAARAGIPNRLVAVCDQDLARLQGQALRPGNIETGSGAFLDLSRVEVYGSAEALLANAAVELASICTPTDTHVALALAALEAGKHVIVEKPVALGSREVERLAEAARRSGRVCMPAMCMRFWPGWTWLKERIDSGEFGPVRSAVFRRLASPPAWSRGFYGDVHKSGGALFDLHVHDADFVRFCFGAPAEVASTGSLEHLTTFYRFEEGPEHVVAEGGWNHSQGFPFHMGYTVVFERATAEYAFGRSPRLLLARDGRAEPVEIGDGTGYEGEIAHALAACAGEARLAATLDEAVGLVRMLEAERDSLETRRPVRLPG